MTLSQICGFAGIVGLLVFWFWTVGQGMKVPPKGWLNMWSENVPTIFDK